MDDNKEFTQVEGVLLGHPLCFYKPRLPISKREEISSIYQIVFCVVKHKMKR